MSGGKRIFRLGIRTVGGLLGLVLLAVTGIALILAQPRQETADAPAAAQPPLTASPALTVSEENGLPDLIGAFPAPVMSFLSGSGMRFVSAVSGDAAWGDGFGRVATLYWQTEDGEPVTLQSIYPAAGLELLPGEGYHFSRTAGPTLFGRDSVRMENGESIRIHAATEQGLYVMLVPLSLSDRLAALSRSLQLFSVQAEE